MKAWITSHRVKPGTQQQFRQRWFDEKRPAGARAAHLLQADEDTREFFSVSFWDDEDALRQQQAEALSEQRPDVFTDLADLQWDRRFDVATPSSGRGRALWLSLPAAMAAAGAGTYFWRQQQRRSGSIVARVAGRRPRWLLPAMLGPAAAVLFFLLRRLRGMGEARVVTQQYTPTLPIPPAPPIPPVPAMTAAQVSTAVPAPVRPLRPTPTEDEAPPLDALMRGRQEDIELHGLLVREVMTPYPETVEFDADLAAAAAKMRELNVGVLPVMADGMVTGIITDRDLAMAMADEGEHTENQTIADVMSSMPVTVGPDATVREASQLLAAHKIRRLLVVQGPKLVGILSIGDLAVEEGGPDVQEALEEISEPAKPQR